MKAIKTLTVTILSVAGVLLFAGGHEARADVRVSVNFNSGYHHPHHYYKARACGPRYYYPRPVYYSPPRYYHPPRYVVHSYRTYNCAPRRVVYCR